MPLRSTTVFMQQFYFFPQQHASLKREHLLAEVKEFKFHYTSSLLLTFLSSSFNVSLKIWEAEE